MLKPYRWWNLHKCFLSCCILILCWLPVSNHSQVTPNKPLFHESELDRALNSHALKSTSSPESTEQLRSRFANPPADHRSMPLWVRNDELDWAHLKQQLPQFKEQGMGGVFIILGQD
jgi:hypothetical protein